MARRTLPDAAYLHQCFLYDPDTGSLTWRHRPREHFQKDSAHKRWNVRYAGKNAGAIRGGGYIYTQIHKVAYAAHRIIWMMMRGEDPITPLDHKNCTPADNRWSNLRLATPLENSRNKSMYKNNMSGFRGVQLLKPAGHLRCPYLARIRVNGTLIKLGYFSTAEEAHGAYVNAAKTYFGEFCPEDIQA